MHYLSIIAEQKGKGEVYTPFYPHGPWIYLNLCLHAQRVNEIEGEDYYSSLEKIYILLLLCEEIVPGPC